MVQYYLSVPFFRGRGAGGLGLLGEEEEGGGQALDQKRLPYFCKKSTWCGDEHKKGGYAFN